MWWILTLVVSVCIVCVIHHVIQYLQDTFTIKKNKDVVKIHVEKYEKMLDDILASSSPKTFRGFCPATENSQEPTCQNGRPITDADIAPVA